MIPQRLTRRARLTGRKIKSDPQRHKVYSMERTIVGWAVGTQTCSTVLSDVISHACREWNVDVPLLEIERRRNVYGSCSDDSINLNPKYDGMNLAVLIHELAHWISDRVFDSPGHDHGPRFVGVYRYLLDRYNMLPNYSFDAMCRHWDVEYEICDPASV